ncbi:MAG: hypothetical protein PHI23_04070 [Candidatus Peribacteraceae bacterium]|nr:hypothetical protein [Candidatus Peribacteraceae bacterium]
MARTLPAKAHLPSRSFTWLLMVAFLGVLLAGCTSITERQARVMRWWAEVTGTASGAIVETKEKVDTVVEQGKAAVEGAQEILDDLGRRADAVKTGIEKIQEGKKFIEEGINGVNGGESSSSR